MAIGTPNRLNKLADIGALSLDDVDLIVVDCARNVKNYNVLEMKDTAKDVGILYQKHVCNGGEDASNTAAEMQQQLAAGGRVKVALW